MKLFWSILAAAMLVVPFAAVSQGAQSATRPPFRYGVIVGDTGNYPKVAGLGFGWVKLYLSWNSNEPARGSYTFAVDDAVRRARANNLHVLALVYDTPAWATGDGTYHPDDPPPANNQDFADFMASLAAHYQGQIDAYEIWNEENTNGFWGHQYPDPARYAAMLQALYPRVKQADPNALVISGGLANTGAGNDYDAMGDLSYIQAFLQAGGGSVVDAIGIHPYLGACSPDSASCDATPGTYFRRAEDERAAEVQAGGGNLPLWITETGDFSVPGQIDPAAAGCNGSNGLGGFPAYEVDQSTKAANLVAAYQYAYANWPWLGMMMAMNLDLSTVSWYAQCDPVRFWALLTASGDPTPAYSALQAMPKQTPQVTFSPSSAYGQASGVVTITGAAFDPTASGGVGVDAIAASVDAPYDSATAFPSATLGLPSPGVSSGYGPGFANAGFQVTVDTSHLDNGHQPLHIVYVYAHTPAAGWIVGTLGLTVQPQMTVTPELLDVWIDPSVQRTASKTIALGRNDDNSDAYGWSASSNASWLSVPSYGQSHAPLTVAINASGLRPGLYRATITIAGVGSAGSYFKNSPVAVPVTLHVGAKYQVALPGVTNSPPAGL